MKNIIRLIVAIFIILGVNATYSNYLQSETFKLSEIHLLGDINNLDKELEMVYKTLEGRYLWSISEKDLEALFLNDIRVRDIQIKKSYPDKLYMKVRGKSPLYYILSNKRVYGLDGEYKAFAFLDEFPTYNYPLLVIEEEGDIKELATLSNKWKDTGLGDLISQVKKLDNNNIELLLLDGTLISTNQEVTPLKYKVVEKLYLNLVNEEKKIERIDLRFNDYVVKFKGDDEE